MFVQTQKMQDEFTPRIEVKKRLKKIIVSGSSRMADPSEYYTELSKQLEKYYYLFKNLLFLEFKLDYINTGSSKWLYTLLNHIQSLKNSDGVIEVSWFFEEDDETIQESGELLKALVDFPFRLIPYK